MVELGLVLGLATRKLELGLELSYAYGLGLRVGIEI